MFYLFYANYKRGEYLWRNINFYFPGVVRILEINLFFSYKKGKIIISGVHPSIHRQNSPLCRTFLSSSHGSRTKSLSHIVHRRFALLQLPMQPRLSRAPPPRYSSPHPAVSTPPSAVSGHWSFEVCARFHPVVITVLHYLDPSLQWFLRFLGDYCLCMQFLCGWISPHSRAVRSCTVTASWLLVVGSSTAVSLSDVCG